MPALRQPFQSGAIFALDLREATAHDLALWYEHEIEPAYRVVLVTPEAFSEEPLGPVPFHGPADPPPHRETQTGLLAAVLDRQQEKQGAVESKTLSKDPSKLRREPDSLA